MYIIYIHLSTMVYLIYTLAELLNVVMSEYENGAIITNRSFAVIGQSMLTNSKNESSVQLALTRGQLRSIAFACSVFVDGLVLQQCQFTEIFIVTFHTFHIESPCDTNWLSSWSSLRDPPFSLYTGYIFAVAMATGYSSYRNWGN